MLKIADGAYTNFFNQNKYTQFKLRAFYSVRILFKQE